MNIVLLESLGISPELLSIHADKLASLGHTLTAYERCDDPAVISERCREADAVMLANMPLSAECFEGCERLRYVDIAFTGVDHVPMDYFRSKRIKVSNASGYATEAVAELCIEYMISESIVLDTEKFKKVLESISDDAEGQFSDGWGESLEQRSIKIGDQEYYLRATSDIFWIVTNVRFAESLLVRWKSISEIEHTEWMLSHLNIYSGSLIALSREKELAGVMTNSEMLKFVESNRDKFFIA